MTVTTQVERDVFTNGRYAESFRPDATSDPFHRLYSPKRRDVIASVSRLPEGSRVLDLGGGMGRIAVPLAQRRYQVTLCDISDDMLAMASQAGREAGVSKEDLTPRRVDASQPLPFATASFDCAIALDLLVHLPDPVAALRELRRVVAPEGEIIVDITNRSPWWVLRYPRYVGRRPRLRWLRTLRGGGVLPEWQGIVHHYTRPEFRRMLDEAGFHVVEHWRYGPPGCPKWFLERCRAAG